MRKAVSALVLLGLFLAARGWSLPSETADGAGHGGPVVPVLLGLVVILVAAKVGGEIVERMGQRAVLGELLFGMVLGNLALLGFGRLEFLHTSVGVEILAQRGVILLLFQVGLESSVPAMHSRRRYSLL